MQFILISMAACVHALLMPWLCVLAIAFGLCPTSETRDCRLRAEIRWSRFHR